MSAAHFSVPSCNLPHTTNLGWRIPVVYTSADAQTHQFHVSTSTSWMEFSCVAAIYLRLRISGGGIGYRFHHQQGGLGELGTLGHATDWEGVKLRLDLLAFAHNPTELVLYDVSIFLFIELIRKLIGFQSLAGKHSWVVQPSTRSGNPSPTLSGLSHS